MKESFKQEIKETAKSWGCKIDDQLAFYHHYNEFKAQQRVVYGYFITVAIIILLLLILG